MAHVHYKFSSQLSYNTVVFDGPHITLKDLKRQIMVREKLRAGDCDLQITNAQTKEEYTDDDGPISKGASVIIRRIPIKGAKSGSNSKTRHVERSDVHPHYAFGAVKAMDDHSSSSALPFFSKMANLADADVSEEDKIKVMINQSTYDSMNYNKKFGTVLPANYTCYRCGNTGHHIRNCPTSGQDKNFETPVRIKKSTGIPRSFMVEVDNPNVKGAMLTNCGRYAIPAIDAEAYAVGKKEKPPFFQQERPKSECEEDPVPDELLCLICHDLLSDAVVIPCCGNSYCDDCIRNALLDSEEHVCPTCSQSDVSPDTLIANKFLRQAVNTFKKEQVFTKNLRGRSGTSQSQNPTPTPSPVPTPPPLAVQIQPPKPPQSTHSQQDPLLYHAQAADTPPSSQVCGAPPIETGPASAPNTPGTSLQPAESHPEISDREPEEKTHDDSAAPAPSVPVSHKDPTAAPSQLVPLVDHSAAVEKPQTVSVNLQQSSSGPAPRHSGPSQCWDGSSSSSGCPTRGWKQASTQPLPLSSSSSSSSYPATLPPPLFPSPNFHMFLAAQQPLNSFPPGFLPATPVWTLPTLQGSSIPSRCSSASASTSSIPALIPKEWYRHQREKKERSPHRGSTYRRSSSSRSNSKSSKSKSSRSYSRSSSRSRSRSRSRSQGRSRGHHTRPHSYSYGYKRSRSPTPSSSSSPRVGYDSRSKSPSDHRKNHHGRHHHKKSASSSCSSKKRGERPQGEAGGSGESHPFDRHANQSSGQELDRERYLQWKREYKEWCEKYFNSYVGHFHHLPPQPPNLAPPSPPQWGDRKGNRSHPHAKPESRTRVQGSRHSPPSSSKSRSPPSQSSSDSRSTSSQSYSDSRSSPSHSSNDSRSPPSRSSSDRRSTPSEDGAQPRANKKDGRLPITLTKGNKDVELQERSKDDKQQNLEIPSTLKHEQKSMKKHEEGRGEESSSPDAADSTDDCRTDKMSHNTGPIACKDGTPSQDKTTGTEALKSVQPCSKPDKRLDKDYERKSREQRNSEPEKGWRRGKYSHSRRDVERRHKEKPSKGAGRVDSDRYRNPGGSKDSDSRSEKNRKRKAEDTERHSAKAQSSKCLKTETAEDPKTRKSESPNPFDRKKQEKEKNKMWKAWPLTERDVWEGGIKVKPQKKISININLGGKRKDEKTEKNGEEENRGETEVNKKKESSGDQEGESEERIKPDEGEARQMWEKATFRDDKQEITGETKDLRDEVDVELWHCALIGAEDGKKQLEERDRMEASKGEEVTNDERRRVRKDSRGQEKLVPGVQKERTAEEDRATSKEELMEGVKWGMRKEEEDRTRSNSQRSQEPNTMVDDGSSYERKTVVKALEEFTQEGAADKEDELVFIQVPRSKWEKESEEEEQDEGEIKGQTDALAASVTAETPTDGETEKENEQKRQTAVEMEEGRDGGREKNSSLSSSHRSVAPSSGNDRSDSTSCTDKGRRMETERPRDRERGRERERPKDRQKESKRSKEGTREDKKGRDRERERGHSSTGSVQTRNPPSSSHSYSYSTSHDAERRDRQRGGDQGSSKTSSCPGGKISGCRSRESSATSRATDLPDENEHRTHRDTFLDKDRPQYYHNHQDPPENYRPAGTHHSPPSLPYIWGKERDPLFAKTSGGSELKVEKEWKQNKVDKVIKEGKRERQNQDRVAERGGRWEDEAVTWGEGGRELEEGERPSSHSNSSSASQESSSSSSSDDGRKEWKTKQKKQKQEKRQAAPELLEEGELTKHKKRSTKSRDGGEEESKGETEGHAKHCSVTLY